MTTYDENGGYPHPDHIMCHKISVVAFDAAGDPEQHPELGEPWQPLKLYYNSGWTRARMLALHEGMLAAGLESPYAEWLEKWSDRDDRGDKITTRVECGEYFEVRDDALRAHATQVDPDGFWFHIPLELQQKVWPTEDFELARSVVDSPIPESDLFAGIREPVERLLSSTAECVDILGGQQLRRHPVRRPRRPDGAVHHRAAVHSDCSADPQYEQAVASASRQFSRRGADTA